ncbi:MAG: DUF3298 and DUF4163 domain-containing protein [Candidatus Pacebacteria bacterium]|nr:DUF3298 and DUF4163 domain-containing protein [Candidatus Paceibacterota bacterium]
MKNNLTPLLLIICLFLGAFAGMSYKESKVITQPIFQNTYTEPEPGSLKVQSVYQSDNLYYISAEYPQFLAVKGTLNDKIKGVINKRLEEFKKSSSENWKARKDTDPALGENPETPFYFSASWTPVQVNDKYISILLNVYSFSGGAHGDEEVYSFNYDIKNNKEITISDFIGTDPKNLEKISEMTTEDVKNMVDKNNIFAEGTATKVENFQTFTFNKDILTIYYQKYQVAPGSEGILKSIFNEKTLEENKINASYFK